MKKSGFTMIELLVVIAIIGILMTLGLGSYTKSLSRGRDSKRIQDMKEAQKSFELYYSLNNTYLANPNYNLMFTPQTGRQPVPPAGGLDYFCSNCTTTSYTYCTRLENGADYGNYTCNADTSTATCAPANSGQTHYCVLSVQ